MIVRLRPTVHVLAPILFRKFKHIPYTWPTAENLNLINYSCGILVKMQPTSLYGILGIWQVCKLLGFFFWYLVLNRSVPCGQRGLQSPVHRGTRERCRVFLSPGASSGLQQQDVWGGGLLHPSPEVQPGVWAVQDHSEVLLLSGMDTWRWRGHLSQHR